MPPHVPIPSLDACGGPSQTVRIPAVLDATCQQPSILSLCLSDATSKRTWKTACHVTRNNHKRLCHVLFSSSENIEDGQMYRTEQSCVSGDSVEEGGVCCYKLMQLRSQRSRPVSGVCSQDCKKTIANDPHLICLKSQPICKQGQESLHLFQSFPPHLT